TASGEWSYGDVVLLFRAMTSSDIYENALRKRGIPCTSSGGRSFLERREVADLIAATRYAQDPGDSVALLTLLRSPVAGLSDDEIALMAGKDGRGLPSAIEKDERLSLVCELPSMAAHMRPSEIMRRAINEAGLEVLWSRLDPSGAANMNMDRLVTIARDLEREMPTTLANFNSFMKEMRARGGRLGDSPAGTESGNAVRLMTVHAAKGLEFPVVFLPDLMRSMPRNKNHYIFSRGDAGSGSGISFKKRNPDQPFGSRIATDRFTKFMDEEALRDEKESKRLLYVAMTRAKGALVFPMHDGIKTKGTWHEWMGKTLREHGGKEIALRVEAPAPRTSEAEGQGIAGVDLLSPPAQRARASSSRLLSVSALDSYSICPMLYYLKYVLGLPASEVTRRDTGRIEPNVYGSIVHAMLARATDDAGELIAVAISEGLANGVDVNERSAKELVADAKKAIELAHRGRISVGFRELPFELTAEGSIISGTIDWLLPVSGGFEVIDFKTGLKEMAKAEARAEQYEMQMQAYSLAAEAITGGRVLATNLVFPSAGLTLRREMDDTRRTEARENIRRIVGGIEACDYAVAKSPPCASCIFHRNGMCWEDRMRKRGRSKKAISGSD
ncbi:MAG: 3'-5' exonuclease, partial [bacterium]